MSTNPDRCYYEIVYTPDGVKSFTVSASIHGHLNGYESDRTPFNNRSQLIADAMQRGVDWQRQNIKVA
ncbi:MAG: hypothetical protein WC733_00025 [Methylophilus sp.]|jgi:homospermidine synthase